MIIYVTGKSGSGKSTFSKELAKRLGYNYIDVDKIGHKIYEYPELMEKVYDLFGDAINDENGNFNRKKLGQIIFNEKDTPRVKAFNDLTWECMKKILEQELTDCSVVDYILLPHTEYWSRNALRILVKPQDDNLRLEKIMSRDNISKEYVKLRDSASIEYNENEFNFVFVNSYNESALNNNIQTVVNYIFPETTLKVLGTQSPYSKSNNACPSFLLTDARYKLLLDCGSGSHRFFNMSNLEDLGIVVSHFHRDHYNDLYNYMYSSFVLKNQGKLKNPIQLYLPGTPKNIFCDIDTETLTFSKTNQIEEYKIYEFGNFKFQFLRTIHSSDILSFATKISIHGKTVVYTGDLSYKGKDAIISFAKDADILICEASFLESHGFPKECNHLTALQAGEIAKEANVKKLILTHFWPEEHPINYYLEAKKVFNNVFIAKENEEYLI